MCTLCHGEQFSGGAVPGEQAAPLAPNLTLLTRADWSEEDFFKVVRTGVNKVGKQLDPDHMPWDHLAKMTDDEIKALWLFLSSLEPRTFGN